jgi:hypothetical protein
MNHLERLLRQADAYFDIGEQLPLTLASALMAEGVDVTALERKHL